jgi:hypothetical protein
VVGKPPRFGTGGTLVPPELTMAAKSGIETQILLTVSDPDAILEPFPKVPLFSVWAGPEWAVLNQLAVTYNERDETFHNWLYITPPFDFEGDVAFSIMAEDTQGLRVNRWFFVKVNAP